MDLFAQRISDPSQLDYCPAEDFVREVGDVFCLSNFLKYHIFVEKEKESGSSESQFDKYRIGDGQYPVLSRLQGLCFC